MKLPNLVRVIWWVVLVGFFIYLIIQRYNSIVSGAASVIDIIIFLVLIALVTIPLFQEVNFFGVNLKREFDNFRSEVKEQIINLRSDIQNTISMRTEINPQIYLTPPTDSELPSIEERIRPILEQVLREQGIERPTPVSEEPEISDNTKYLFSVRYSIENELMRLSSLLWAPYIEKQRPPILSIATSLSNIGKITPEVVDIIREVYAICSSAIHGREVSAASIKFVRDTSPPLLAYLKSIAGLQWFPKEQD